MITAVERLASRLVCLLGIALMVCGVVELSMVEAVAAIAPVGTSEIVVCEAGTCFSSPTYCKPGPWCCTFGLCVGVSW